MPAPAPAGYGFNEHCEYELLFVELADVNQELIAC
jgi:hypothetical protein